MKIGVKDFKKAYKKVNLDQIEVRRTWNLFNPYLQIWSNGQFHFQF